MLSGGVGHVYDLRMKKHARKPLSDELGVGFGGSRVMQIGIYIYCISSHSHSGKVNAGARCLFNPFLIQDLLFAE